MQALIASNDDMRSELAKLNSTVQRLVHDNKELQAGQKIYDNNISDVKAISIKFWREVATFFFTKIINCLKQCKQKQNPLCGMLEPFQ